LTKYALDRADALVVTCVDLKKSAVEEFGVDESKIKVVDGGRGVDFDLFKPNVKSNKRERLEIGNSPIVISTRNFMDRYNIHVIINSIPAVLKKVPNTKFIFLGEGPLEDRLKRRIHTLGVSKSVPFIGKVEHEEVVEYLSISDVFVSIPISDSISTSLREAMACGVAPIVSDLPSQKEWITHGWNGFTIPIKISIEGGKYRGWIDQEALVHYIVELIKRKDLRELFAMRNYEIVRRKADHFKCMEMVEELYKKLVTNVS
jgi:glycosyltransferase involved in cell wall biosynthesis